VGRTGRQIGDVEIREGLRVETIHEAQVILVRLKYLERGRYKEGEWDPLSRRAARDFQRDQFLKPNGQLDRGTLAVLLSHKPRPEK